METKLDENNIPMVNRDIEIKKKNLYYEIK